MFFKIKWKDHLAPKKPRRYRLAHMLKLWHTHWHAQVREPLSGFINATSLRETREVTMVSLFYFLSSLSRGKQTWMMSFLNPMETVPSVFLFLYVSGKNMCMPSSMWVGVKFSSKRDGEGQYGDKRLVNVTSSFDSRFMSSHSFNREAELPLLLTLKLKESLRRYSYSHSVHAFSFAVSLSFPSPLYVPTSPHPHPRLSSISLYRTLLLSFCHPALYFIQMGKKGI